MRCDDALAAISAAVDGELADDDGTVRAALDEHLTGCDECRDFQSYTVELRARLRFEAVDATPDVAPAVVAVLERAAAERDAQGEADRGKGTAGRDPGATVTALPFWRRAGSVLRPAGRAGRAGRTARAGRAGQTGPGGSAGTSPSSPGPRGRPLAAAVAAALVTGMVVGAVFVGVGQDTTPTAWAEDLPQQVVEAQHDITSLDADIVVTERGRPDHDGERRFTGHLSYEAPERLALELTEDVERGIAERAADVAGDAAGDRDDGGDGRARLQPGEGDVHLLVRDDRWWLETVRRCTVVAGQTSCATGGSRWTLEVTGREAFSDAAPIPLELIGAVDSFTLAAAPPVLGERRIAGRDAIGVRVSAAQVAHFLAALSPGGDLRAVHPSDPVDVWLDRDDLVPLAVDVTAARSDERAAWATANDFREQPGDTVLSFSVVSIAVNEAVPDAAFEWTEDEAATTVTEDPTGSGGAVDPTGSAASGDGLGEDGPGTDDGALPAGGTGSVDGTDGGGLGQGAGSGPVGGAVLPTSTTTTVAGAAPADGGALPQDDGSVRRTAPGGVPATTTSSPTSSTTLPGGPGDPPLPTSTTTSAPTTTVPPLVTTTTTGPVDDGAGDTVEPPVDDDPAAGDDATVDDDGTAGPDQAPVDHRTPRDDGFRVGEAALVPEPSRLPDGMEPHASGTIRTGDGPIIGVRSWTDGRAWVKVRATDGWDGPRLFGELGDAVRQVDLGVGGQGYVSADGRKIALHTDRLDVVVCGSLPTEQLREIAGSLDVAGEPVPGDWPESASATLEEARAAQPGLLVPQGLEGFGPPAVGIDDGSVSQLYAGPGDRTFTLTRSDTPMLAPPAGDDSFGVDVRGVDGRYSVDRGELEWTEDGAAYSLLSRTVALSELLTIADALAPLPAAP